MKKETEFKAYLESKCKLDYDVQEHIKNVNYFNDWLKANLMSDIIRVTTIILYQYVKYLQETSIKVGTINIRLNSLRKYYACMIKLGYITRNPALSINIGGTVKKVVEHPLSDIELNNLAQNFNVFMDAKPKPINIKSNIDKLTKQRYKLIVSLMVYQGLDTGELDRLYVSNIDIKNYTIYVASRNRRNNRTLKLEVSQVLEFYNYLQSLPADQEKLFSISAQSTMNYLLGYLKGVEPKLKNAEHIRQSRIMVWVSTLKLLDAKERIGHKFVSSTERYQLQDTTEIVDEINRLHLFS
jgi:integrase/recombinase XerD